MTKKYLATLTDSQTLTNKTIDADSNTISNINVSNLKTKTSADAGKSFVVQSDGTWALAQPSATPDNVTIGTDSEGKLEVKDGSATDGITFAKLNTGLPSTSIPVVASASDEKLPTEKAVRTELDKKIDTAQGAANAGKFLKVGADGNVSPADATVKDVQVNGTTILNDGVANIVVNDTLTSTSTSEPLSAKQGKVLNDKIDAISSRGKFLSLWNCQTGLAVNFSETTPYSYQSGDYFIVSVTSSTNLIPNGATYTGTASSTSASDSVTVGDQYMYNGTAWNHIPSVTPASVQDVTVNGVSVLSGTTAVIPAASTSVTGALTSTDWNTFNGKQDAIAAGTAGNVVIYSGTQGTVGSLAVDTTPTVSSSNLITSGAVKTAIAGNVPYATGSVTKLFSVGVDANGYYIEE